MATDIFDQDLRVLRELRWERAWNSANCKATLVVEHVLQTSDVGHTMQRWEIYREWNESLFNEMYTAFWDGRADKDPSESWYQGELWFFDNWALPLAQSVKDSGALNIVSDQLLQQARQNRSQWEQDMPRDGGNCQQEAYCQKIDIDCNLVNIRLSIGIFDYGQEYLGIYRGGRN